MWDIAGEGISKKARSIILVNGPQGEGIPLALLRHTDANSLWHEQHRNVHGGDRSECSGSGERRVSVYAFQGRVLYIVCGRFAGWCFGLTAALGCVLWGSFHPFVLWSNTQHNVVTTRRSRVVGKIRLTRYGGVPPS